MEMKCDEPAYFIDRFQSKWDGIGEWMDACQWLTFLKQSITDKTNRQVKRRGMGCCVCLGMELH